MHVNDKLTSCLGRIRDKKVAKSQKVLRSSSRNNLKVYVNTIQTRAQKPVIIRQQLKHLRHVCQANEGKVLYGN